MDISSFESELIERFAINAISFKRTFLDIASFYLPKTGKNLLSI